MTRLIIILALGIAVWLGYKLYFQKLIGQGKAGKIKLALIVLGLIFVVLAFTGRANIAFAVIGALMTQVMRIAPLLVRFFPMFKQLFDQHKVSNPAAGRRSNVRTELLVMTLDHDTGSIDGEVTRGTFSGRRLGDLSRADIGQLLQECRHADPEGVQLLKAYITRIYGEEDDNGTESPPPNEQQVASARPSKAEACEILGVEASAEHKDIVDAHRRLMGRLHPDKGGSNYLASKINAAKEVLLEGSKRT